MTPQDLIRPKLLLRLEGIAALGIALVAYAAIGKSWWLFVLLFLAPDLSLLAYFANRRILALAYNAVHSYVLPAGLFAFGFLGGRATPMAWALIWVAHIGVDRALGFGLKYRDRPVRETHLQRL